MSIVESLWGPLFVLCICSYTFLSLFWFRPLIVFGLPIYWGVAPAATSKVSAEETFSVIKVHMPSSLKAKVISKDELAIRSSLLSRANSGSFCVFNLRTQRFRVLISLPMLVVFIGFVLLASLKGGWSVAVMSGIILSAVIMFDVTTLTKGLVSAINDANNA